MSARKQFERLIEGKGRGVNILLSTFLLIFSEKYFDEKFEKRSYNSKRPYNPIPMIIL